MPNDLTTLYMLSDISTSGINSIVALDAGGISGRFSIVKSIKDNCLNNIRKPEPIKTNIVACMGV